jgi:hypothetical protein
LPNFQRVRLQKSVEKDKNNDAENFEAKKASQELLLQDGVDPTLGGSEDERTWSRTDQIRKDAWSLLQTPLAIGLSSDSLMRTEY